MLGWEGVPNPWEKPLLAEDFFRTRRGSAGQLEKGPCEKMVLFRGRGVQVEGYSSLLARLGWNLKRNEIMGIFANI